MNVTVNQIRQEMATLVQAHDMVNSFFWGDFHRAYNEKEQFYPLVCSYLSDGAINTNMTQMQLVVIVCDKTFKGFENLNDTESDTVTVARHLYNVIRQSPRWNALLRVNSATFTKFYENTSDEVAGVILTMNVDLKQSRSLCDLPLDNYDFDGTFVGNDCEPVLIVNSNQSFSFNAPSGTIVELPDTPVLVTDQDGNPLANENLPSVTGGTIQVEAGGVCLPANFVVEYADGTPIESGEIPSGGSETIIVPNCEPCEDATYQLTLDGEPLEGGSGSIPSGENANIPIDAFIPECEPPTVIWDGDSDFPISTLDCGEVLDINCETLINGVVVDGTGELGLDGYYPYFNSSGGKPRYFNPTITKIVRTLDGVQDWNISGDIFANEGTEDFPWLATWPEGVTVRQATISDACCDCEPTPCEDATVQINGEEVATVASGGMVNIAVENESGAPIGELVDGVWVVPDCPPCADGVVTVNRDGVFFDTVPVASGGTASINVPSDCPAPSLPDIGGLYKSGLTTSLIANDEGDTEQGDNPNFLRLNFTNCFGNDYMLTGVLGGYQDEAGVYRLKDGTAAANRAAAFPDEIVINHSTWRPSVLTVWGLAYDGVPGVGASTIANFSTNFATIVNPATSIGGFVGGWMPASQRFLSMFPLKNEDADVMNYPPMSSYVTGTGGRWTGTRRDTGWVRFIANIGNPFNRQTTGNVLISTMRKFTFDPITETLS